MNNHTAANTPSNTNAWTHATHRIRTSLLAIAAPILLGALLWPVGDATAANIAKTYYLRNSGSPSFNLTLNDGTAGTETTETATSTKT